MDVITLLSRTNLFAGIAPQQIPPLLESLHPIRRSCTKGEVLLQYGDTCSALGIVLSGHIEAWHPLPDGHRIPAAQMDAGGVFGDILAGSNRKSPVTVQITTDGEVLFIPYEYLLAFSPICTQAHTQLLQNLMRSISEKYFSLMERLELLTLKSLRAKICAYLLHYAKRANADTFTVPHSRAAMAEYLACERSALSRELSRMQTEGLIETYKSSFKLLDKTKLEQAYHC